MKKIAAIVAGVMIGGLTGVYGMDGAVMMPQGTQVQKTGFSEWTFRFPDGRKIVAKNYNAKVGIIGDCGIYDQSGRMIAGGGQGRIIKGTAGKKIEQSGPGEYVKIDDEVTWLPVMVQCQQGAAQLSPQPDPPGTMKPGGSNPGSIRGINPQPEPPHQIQPKPRNPAEIRGINPQPEPPKNIY